MHSCGIAVRFHASTRDSFSPASCPVGTGNSNPESKWPARNTKHLSVTSAEFKPLKTNGKLLYLKTSSYRAVNTFHLGYKNQSIYAVSGTSRCLFSDKYKTHKYSVVRAYSCWMLNCWCIM
jgi:hypothetical protein